MNDKVCVTLAHRQDGTVSHATVTGFDPDWNRLALERLSAAIAAGDHVLVFDDSWQIEHIFDETPTAATEETTHDRD